jgi:hypothetical protein
MPGILLVIWSLVVIGQKEKGLYERNAVRFVVEVVKKLFLMLAISCAYMQLELTLVFWKKSFLASLRET